MSPAAKIRTIHVRMSDVLHEKIVQESDRLGMMTTEMVRWALLQYFQEKETSKEKKDV